jgi:hypothetical protein
MDTKNNQERGCEIESSFRAYGTCFAIFVLAQCKSWSSGSWSLLECNFHSWSCSNVSKQMHRSMSQSFHGFQEFNFLWCMDHGDSRGAKNPTEASPTSKDVFAQSCSRSLLHSPFFRQDAQGATLLTVSSWSSASLHMPRGRACM